MFIRYLSEETWVNLCVFIRKTFRLSLQPSSVILNVYYTISVLSMELSDIWDIFCSRHNKYVKNPSKSWSAMKIKISWKSGNNTLKCANKQQGYTLRLYPGLGHWLHRTTTKRLIPVQMGILHEDSIFNILLEHSIEEDGQGGEENVVARQEDGRI